MRVSGLFALSKKQLLTLPGLPIKVVLIESKQGGVMAKTKRISIGFQPETFAALEDLADASGQSIAGLVSAFMDEAASSFASISQAMRAAKTKPIRALDLLQENLASAQHRASQGQLDLIESRKRHNRRRPKK